MSVLPLRAPDQATVLAANLAGHAQSVAQRRGIEIEVSCAVSAELPTRTAALLGDALRSIVDNAIEHGFRAADRVWPWQLQIAIRSAGSAGVVIEVNDDGAGIDWGTIRSRCIEQGIDARPGALVDALFEPGVSSRLRMIRMLINGAGGELSVSSPPGEGCSVRVLLPG
jgi:chemotaxis protein histidine kinase CheA